MITPPRSVSNNNDDDDYNDDDGDDDNDNTQFKFGSSKPLSRFVCRLDGGEWRECEEESEFPLTDGIHDLAVIAVDPSGRADSSAVSYSWEVSICVCVCVCLRVFVGVGVVFCVEWLLKSALVLGQRTDETITLSSWGTACMQYIFF